jgi:nickel-dependent lactate racemase
MSGSRTLGLRYGRSTVELAVPAAAELLEPQEPALTLDRDSFRAGLAAELPEPLPSGRIVVVVADKTRLCGYPTVLPWLVELLAERGAGPERIVFLIAYGVHSRQSEAESLVAYGPVYRLYPFVHHDCDDQNAFVDLGRTGRGTPARVRRELVEADLVLTVGAISHHYFAGFGGGRKLLFPGLGERRAILANHRLFLDPATRTLHPNCCAGRMAGNPLAEDLDEIARLLPRPLSVHGLLDSSGALVACRIGRGSDAFVRACREHDCCFRAPGNRRYDLVVASAGGYPKDINLIQAHKAMDNAAGFVRDGGTLVLLAECADGVGSDGFLPFFDLGGREQAFDQLVRDYSGNGGTALALMAKNERIRIRLLTGLDPCICQRIGVQPITIAQAEQLLRAKAESSAVIANASLLVR